MKKETGRKVVKSDKAEMISKQVFNLLEKENI